MEAPLPKHEIREEDPAPAPGAVAAELDRPTEGAPLLPKLEIRDPASPAPAPAAIEVGGGDLGSLQQLIDQQDGRLQAAAGEGGGGLDRNALQQLIELEDPCLQAACFFLASGGCIVIYGTVLNPSTNWEHIFLGFVLLTIGAVLAILTLAGGGAGRAAARAEGFLRAFF